MVIVSAPHNEGGKCSYDDECIYYGAECRPHRYTLDEEMYCLCKKYHTNVSGVCLPGK